MTTIEPFRTRTRVAYFSMEIGLRPEIHTYSGGLGVLAGDTVRACADLGVPAVFVTLITRSGYLRQTLDAKGGQVDHDDPWRPEDWASPLDVMVEVAIEGRQVWLRPWLYRVESPAGHVVPVLLLDTDLEQNAPQDRAITERLYGGDDAYRLKQEIVLGIGGERILRALGLDIRTFHMNEGHAALLTVPLLARMTPEEVRRRCVFTTHTPVEAGHDRFDYALVGGVLGGEADPEMLEAYAGEDALNMTRLALNLSGFVNGVAVKHAETAAHMFPGYEIHAITNGVHVPTWTHPAFAALYQKISPSWALEPELLAHADRASDEDLWAARAAAKADLIAEVERRAGVRLNPDWPVLVFARRMTSYKRPELIFSDLVRLEAIFARTPFQLVMAGKAHPRDMPGKERIEQITGWMERLSRTIPMAYLEGYGMELGRIVTSGADIWLNTPLPPMEASGTSGMKAALNGALNLSTLDGWWLEACDEGRTGWGIDGPAGEQPESHASALYDKLERDVLPLYHDDKAEWARMMRRSISKIAPYFNTQRMVRRYVSEAYRDE